MSMAFYLKDLEHRKNTILQQMEKVKNDVERYAALFDKFTNLEYQIERVKNGVVETTDILERELEEADFLTDWDAGRTD